MGSGGGTSGGRRLDKTRWPVAPQAHLPKARLYLTICFMYFSCICFCLGLRFLRLSCRYPRYIYALLRQTIRVLAAHVVVLTVRILPFMSFTCLIGYGIDMFCYQLPNPIYHVPESKLELEPQVSSCFSATVCHYMNATVSRKSKYEKTKKCT